MHAFIETYNQTAKPFTHSLVGLTEFKRLLGARRADLAQTQTPPCRSRP